MADLKIDASQTTGTNEKAPSGPDVHTAWMNLSDFEPIRFISREAVCFAKGCQLTFYDLDTKKPLTYRACGGDAGDGISCYAGHRILPLFAFAEKCMAPRIILFMYPELKPFIVLERLEEDLEGDSNVEDDMSVEGYLQLAFNNQDYLVALGGSPHYTVEVWNWRTRERMSSVRTAAIYPEFNRPNHTIRLSRSSPLLIAQICKGTDTLLIWELLVCHRRSELVSHVIGRYVPTVETEETVEPEQVGEEQSTEWKMDEEEPKLYNPNICNRDTIDSDEHVDQDDESIASPLTYMEVKWNSEGALFIMDSERNIHSLNAEYQLEHILDSPYNEVDSQPPGFVWCRAGLLVAWASDDLRHYKKLQGKWTEDWNIEPEARFRVRKIYSFGHDLLATWSTGGEVMLLDTSIGKFTPLGRHVCNVKSVHVVEPAGDYIVVNVGMQMLALWDAATGQQISELELPELVNTVAAHPKLPYLTVALETGSVVAVTVHRDQKLRVALCMHLIHCEINRLEWEQRGKVLIAACMHEGHVFVICGLPGRDAHVFVHIDYRRSLLDICVHDSLQLYRIYMLVARTEPDRGSVPLSRSVIVKTIVKETGVVKKQKYLLGCKAVARLLVCGDTFIVEPCPTYSFRTVNFVKKRTSVGPHILVGHVLMGVHINVVARRVFTRGIDGCVSVLSKDLKRVTVFYPVHHRTDLGAAAITADSRLRRIFTLGHDGVLVCTEFPLDLLNLKSRPKPHTVEILWPEDSGSQWAKRATTASKMDKSIESITLPEDSIFDLPDEEEPIRYPSGEYRYKNYVTMKKCELEKQQAIMHVDDLAEIAERFMKVKEEVLELYRENQTRPEEMRLPITDYFMVDALRRNKERNAAAEANRIHEEAEKLIGQYQRTKEYMVKTFWEPVVTKRTSVFDLYGHVCVENYAILETQPAITDEDAEHLNAYRELEEMVAREDRLEPCKPLRPEELSIHVQRPPIITSEIEQFSSIEALKKNILIDEEEVNSEDEKNDDDDDDNEENFTFKPSIVHQFIEPSPNIYPQDQVYSVGQMMTQMALLEAENHRLRLHFNERFDQTMGAKEREMDILKERTDRLRFILDELGNEEGLKIHEPTWHPNERPHMILTVLPNEIRFEPYVSPSRQAELDAIAAEEERIRILKAADDFRDRALNDMMDGVLEVRWEDTLKRDIPKPPCMLNKKPENFNFEDHRAVGIYNNEVRFLNSERLRYRKMITTEMNELKDLVQEQTTRFNKRILDLYKYKLDINVAITQQDLQAAQMHVSIIERSELEEKESELRNEMCEALRKSELSAERALEFQKPLTSCRSSTEMLAAKGNVLERAFRREMSERSALVQEQTAKLYKKSPRAPLRGLVTTGLLAELGKCAVTGERSRTLTPDCYEFLRSLDLLDQYVGVPNTVDAKTYRIVCRHRRLRIEHELRMRGALLDLSEAETTIAAYNRCSRQEKARAATFSEQVTALREEILEHQHNGFMQFVLRQELIEMPTKGRVDDYEDAILGPRSEVEAMNAALLVAGERKIKVMLEARSHGDKVHALEWNHRMLRMSIEDMEEEINIVQKMQMTPMAQQFLKDLDKKDAKKKAEKEKKANRKSVKDLANTGEETTEETAVEPGARTDMESDEAMSSDEKALGLPLRQKIAMMKAKYRKLLEGPEAEIRDLKRQIAATRRENRRLDEEIAKVNVFVSELREARDLEWERRLDDGQRSRLAAIRRRCGLLRQIQTQHDEMLVLQTELELLRLRTYPTLRFNTLQ